MLVSHFYKIFKSEFPKFEKFFNVLRTRRAKKYESLLSFRVRIEFNIQINQFDFFLILTYIPVSHSTRSHK